MRAVVRRENELVHGVRGLLGFAELHPDPRADFPVERGALQTFAVAVGIDAAGNFQFKPGRAKSPFASESNFFLSSAVNSALPAAKS